MNVVCMLFFFAVFEFSLFIITLCSPFRGVKFILGRLSACMKSMCHIHEYAGPIHCCTHFQMWTFGRMFSKKKKTHKPFCSSIVDFHTHLFLIHSYVPLHSRSLYDILFISWPFIRKLIDINTKWNDSIIRAIKKNGNLTASRSFNIALW